MLNEICGKCVIRAVLFGVAPANVVELADGMDALFKVDKLEDIPIGRALL